MGVERLRAVTIGEPQVHGGPIDLRNYDPQWPHLFSREARRIKNALGNRALLVEHVGSTSVPGLAAKPVIDILLVVKNSADEKAYVPPLEGAGYILRIREPEWHEHRLFKGPNSNVNLHVFSDASAEVERMILFRDRLRIDGRDRELYARTKRELAGRHWRYIQDYADAKGEVVETILARARSDS
jgi:GrpB-like predicted nucleotidyltransferase (UPF0157 family)